MLANMYSCYHDRGPADGSTVPPRATFLHSRYPRQFDVVGGDCDDWVWIDVYCGVVGSSDGMHTDSLESFTRLLLG